MYQHFMFRSKPWKRKADVVNRKNSKSMLNLLKTHKSDTNSWGCSFNVYDILISQQNRLGLEKLGMFQASVQEFHLGSVFGRQ